jgi:hypothetical protein
MATVVIMSIGRYEIEWTEYIEAPTMKGAKIAATRWIKRNLFERDYQKIEKDQATNTRAYWTIK